MPLHSKTVPAPGDKYLPDLTLCKWDQRSFQYPSNFQIEGIDETRPWPSIPLHVDHTQAVSQNLRTPIPSAYKQHQCLPCHCAVAGSMGFQPIGRFNSYLSEDHGGLKRNHSVTTHDGSMEERPRQSIELDPRSIFVHRPDGVNYHVSQCLALSTCPTLHHPTPSHPFECQPMLKRWQHQTPFEEPYQHHRQVPSPLAGASIPFDGVEPIGHEEDSQLPVLGEGVKSTIEKKESV
jgi:hypothetical protein